MKNQKRGGWFKATSSPPTLLKTKEIQENKASSAISEYPAACLSYFAKEMIMTPHQSIGQKRRLQARSLAGLALGATIALPLATASAQETAPIIDRGDIAITGFSGLKYPESGIPPGVNPIDESFINEDAASLKIFKADNLGGPPQGQLVNLPAPFEVKASEIGQVFGLAFDDGKRAEGEPRVPNLYVTSSVLHGLQIVGPDTDDDGRKERLKQGQADAEFMEGQFGLKNGGTPGAIWKVDGLTGEVSLFANVTLEGAENSGPGLVNIAFDKITQQLFVSDLDTGFIHRFNLNGEDLGTFDHGATGRPVLGLGAASHDPGNRMDITNPSFKAQNPETWGLAAVERRVWGLQVHGRRLYYYAEDGGRIMSVAINKDGNFGAPRWELDVNSESGNPITDIAFDNKGYMYLSERGKLQNKYDYTEFASPENSRVLRYHLENPDDPETPSRWVEAPETYAVGFKPEHKQALGGIDLQYDYNEDGTINYATCTAYLVKSGDNLRDNEELKDKLGETGPLVVHGIQLTHIDLTQPGNTPPWESYFADFDGLHDDPEVRGMVGDVEIYRPCEGELGYGDIYPYPEDIPEPEDYPGDDIPPGGKGRCIEVEAIDYYCSPAGDLAMDLYLSENAGIGADSLKTKSFTPGIHVTPKMQTVPGPLAPYQLDVLGILPNENYDLGVCLYNKADAEAGGEFPCCKAVLPLKAPPFVCGP